MERRFVSGDIVDIMFVGAHGYAVVEIEIGGGRSDTGGHLSDGEGSGLRGRVDPEQINGIRGGLVTAYDILAVVAEAARTLRVKAIRIDREPVASPMNVEVG